MVARLHHRAQRRNRGHSRAKAVRRTPALKRAQALLQRIARRVRQPRILMPLVLPNRLLLIGRRQIDRHIHRASQLIRWLPIMNRPRRKALLRIGHASMVANPTEKGSH